MIHKWKAGDKAMLLVSLVTGKGDSEGEVLVAGARENGRVSWASAELLQPVSAPDPLAEAKERVVEAAVAERVALLAYNNAPKAANDLRAVCAHEACNELRDATDALITLRTLPEPVVELIRATTALAAFLSLRWSSEPPKQVTDALAAVAAVEKAQKP